MDEKTVSRIRRSTAGAAAAVQACVKRRETLSHRIETEKAVSGNKFVLKSDRIEVEYTIGINPGFPALTYSDGSSGAVSFTSSEIATDETALGTLVSVPLLKTIDTGAQRFGFFLPQVNVLSGQSEQFTTVGVYERLSGPDTVPHLPSSWSSIELHGTAQTVMVPL